MSDQRGVTGVDKCLGERVRARRLARGISQEQLAAIIGVTFQQIQKYETGENRISASRLLDIAAALDMPIAGFFEGLQKPGRSDDGSTELETALAMPGAVELVKVFAAVGSSRLRRRILDLVQAMHEES